MKTIHSLTASGALLLTLCTSLTSCKKTPAPTKLVPPSVTVTHPKATDVTNHIDFTGTVGAFQSVNVVARVKGYLEVISFQDGSYVTKGTPLCKIQQDEYIDQLKINQAKLDYDSAEYARQLTLVKQNATSEANVQKYLSLKQEDEGNVAIAKLNLDYTTLTAPFDGLLGAHQVDVGNLVGNSPTNPTTLVTIEQITPVYVNFSINTRDALAIRTMMRANGIVDKSGVGKKPVFAQLENEKDFPHEGKLDFSNNSVDTSTGTIQIRGIFPNLDRTLFPGLFALVRMPLGPPQPGIVLPDSAVLSDQEGDYVLIVDSTDKVERRTIVKGPLNGSNRAITKGVATTDRVVILGIPNISIGQTVKVTLENSPAK